jgi:hypothetical protein
VIVEHDAVQENFVWNAALGGAKSARRGQDNDRRQAQGKLLLGSAVLRLTGQIKGMKVK